MTSYYKLKTMNEQKEKTIGATNSLDNTEDNFVSKNSKDNISILQNIVSRMGSKGFTGKFEDNKFILSYTCYVTGIANNKKDEIEKDIREGKSMIEDAFKDKTGRSIKLKEIGEDFDVQNSYTIFKQSRVVYTKIYEIK